MPVSTSAAAHSGRAAAAPAPVGQPSQIQTSTSSPLLLFSSSPLLLFSCPLPVFLHLYLQLRILHKCRRTTTSSNHTLVLFRCLSRYIQVICLPPIPLFSFYNSTRTFLFHIPCILYSSQSTLGFPASPASPTYFCPSIPLYPSTKLSFPRHICSLHWIASMKGQGCCIKMRREKERIKQMVSDGTT